LNNNKDFEMLSFHHFGLATQHPEKTDIILKAIGYKPGLKVYDHHQKVFAHSYEHKSQPMIEVLSDQGEKSPLTNFLSKTSSLIYHICYSVNNYKEAIDMFAKNGVEYVIVSRMAPSELFKGSNVSFIFIKNLGLIEILESGHN